MSSLQANGSIPLVTADSLDLQPGGNSNLVKGKWNGRIIAVKRLAVGVSEEALEDHARRWNPLTHPNISSTFVGAHNSDPLFIVIPFYEQGNISQYLAKNPQSDRLRMLLDIATGMSYLHQCGLLHGRLTTSNIFICNGQITLAEYDLSELSTSKNAVSFHYSSPETLRGLAATKASDVFAFAMVCLEVMTSILPWGGLSEKHVYYLVVYEHSRPERPNEIDDNDLWDIICSAWNEDPRNRPGFDIIARLLRAVTPSRSNGILDSPFLSHSPISDDSGPPAYEDRIVPASAPPTTEQFSFSKRKPIQERTQSLQLPHSYSWYSNDSRPETASPSRLSPAPVVVRNLDRNLDQRATIRDHVSSASSSSGRRQTYRLSSKHAYGVVLAPDSEEDTSTIYSDNTQAEPLPHLNSQGFNRQWETTSYTQERTPRHQQSFTSTVSNETRSLGQTTSAQLVVGALQAELDANRNPDAIDSYLARLYVTCSESKKEVANCVTAGLVPVLIHLLRTRAADGVGIEIVLITLGTISYDSITSNIILRSNTSLTLIELVKASISPEICVLAVWCLGQLLRSAEIAWTMIKDSDIIFALKNAIVMGDMSFASVSVYCIGALIQSDSIADALAPTIPFIVGHLRKCDQSIKTNADHISAGLFAVARISRSIKLAKALTKEGVVEIVSRHLNRSNDPNVLNWAARAVGCLMRPNSSDMASALLNADVARGLARVPTVLPSDNLQALGSLGFAVQRFSCAEWSGKIRQSLVNAGVVDSLLAALRTVADEPCFDVQIELALAISLLGDVGGGAIRKELVNAGAIVILKTIGERNPEVAKAASMAKTSLVGNIWSRNAASAKTAMAHNWNGGCPDYYPPCPLMLQV